MKNKQKILRGSVMNHLEYIHCPSCGLTLKEIREEYKIGCQNCLISFRDAIEQMLIEKVGNITYGGQYVEAKEVAIEDANIPSAKVEQQEEDCNNDSTIASSTLPPPPQKKTEKEFASKSVEEAILKLERLLEKSVAAEDYEAAIYFRNEIERLKKL